MRCMIWFKNGLFYRYDEGTRNLDSNTMSKNRMWQEW